MSERLAAAETALKAGRSQDAISHLIAACVENPAQSAPVYRVLATQLYMAKRYEEGEAWAGKGVQRYPRDFDLLNLLAVLRRNLRRFPEALEAIEQAVKIAPNNVSAQVNRGNILLDIGDAVRAE